MSGDDGRGGHAYAGLLRCGTHAHRRANRAGAGEGGGGAGGKGQRRRAEHDSGHGVFFACCVCTSFGVAAGGARRSSS